MLLHLYVERILRFIATHTIVRLLEKWKSTITCNDIIFNKVEINISTFIHQSSICASFFQEQERN